MRCSVIYAQLMITHHTHTLTYTVCTFTILPLRIFPLIKSEKKCVQAVGATLICRWGRWIMWLRKRSPPSTGVTCRPSTAVNAFVVCVAAPLLLLAPLQSAYQNTQNNRFLFIHSFKWLARNCVYHLVDAVSLQCPNEILSTREFNFYPHINYGSVDETTSKCAPSWRWEMIGRRTAQKTRRTKWNAKEIIAFALESPHCQHATTHTRAREFGRRRVCERARVCA